jgi:uncharacterized membrane protein HdeD (DUF308 family)
MDKTWRPIASGIIQIVAGSLFLIGVLLACVISNLSYKPVWSDISSGILFVLIILIFSILGILGIIGGIFALKRKRWRLALAGSIVSVLHPFIFWLGIAAIILITRSKNEFE